MISKKIGIVDCNNFYVSCERVFKTQVLCVLIQLQFIW